MVGIEAPGGEVRERRVEVGLEAVGAQRHDLGHHRSNVVVREHRVSGAVEQVGRDGEVALGGEATADVLHVVVDAERLLEHDDRGGGVTFGLGLVENHLAAGALERHRLRHRSWSFRSHGFAGGSPTWGNSSRNVPRVIR